MIAEILGILVAFTFAGIGTQYLVPLDWSEYLGLYKGRNLKCCRFETFGFITVRRIAAAQRAGSYGTWFLALAFVL